MKTEPGKESQTESPRYLTFRAERKQPVPIVVK